MSARRAVKIAVDAAMFGLMLWLMSYPLTRGLLRHGVCGCLLFALFICHHLLNAGWYRALGRGRWNFRRALLTATDALLLIDIVALAASSLALAGEVFPFAPFPMSFWGRGLHTASAAWCFVLVAFHLGLHGQGLWSRAQRGMGRAWPVAATALAAFGGFSFLESGLWSDMLLLGEPKLYPANLPAFVAQYLGVTLFFCLAAQAFLRCGSRK